MGKILTSESVTPGHPDKLCDRISDSILDALLSEDPDSRVAVETMATAHTLTIAGEVTTKADVSPDFYEKIAGEVYDTIGYDRPAKVNVDVTEQSPQIAQGVFGDTIQGAGDQGIMFGYASNEFANYMPAPITLAHGLAQKLWGAYRSGLIDALGPDGKTQVTCSYGEDGIRVDTVVVSAQHSEGVEFDDVKREIIAKVIRPYLVTNLKLTPSTIMVNPAGPWTVGGPEADTGLTGRKIIVDTYGGAARHGGGAFSGKDPSKVDRSAAYMARYLAKNIVARGIADRCEIQLSYAIGYPEPVSVLIETFGTGDPAEAEKFVGKFDLRPGAIIERLDLKRPIYAQTSSFGHFGNPSYTWEVIE